MENKLANPAPLGLMGFGMTTVLLNLHNAGLFGLGTMILAMGLFYGGIAQIIAGIMEFKKGNTFGTTAFTSYGLFWISLVALLILPAMNLGFAAPAESGFASYLLMWGVFTLWMFLSTLKTNRCLQFIFLSLAILFFLLATGHFLGSATDSGAMVLKIAGIEGIICGFSAIYLAMAEVMNEMYDKVVMPIFPVNK